MENFIIYYGLTILAILITISAQIFISCTYSKFKRVGNKRNISGSEVARMILEKNGLSNIYVVETRGNLTDHYDPRRKVVRLSKEIYNLESIASVAVAAHECGHAIQDKENYSFMKIRAFLVPIVNFSSYAGYIAILLGVVFSLINMIWVGIFLEMVILLFQLVTLPVEINASKRGLKELEELNILDTQELAQGRLVLISAAMTYVASCASTLLEMLRLILIFTNNRDD